MDRLQAMAVFVAVVDAGSFAGAARKLGLSPPVITRAVAELEQRLGLPLLTRTTRVVRVTEAGARYAEDCRRIVAEAEQAEADAVGVHAAPRGLLTLTAPVLFGRHHVMPVVLAYLRRHPGIEVDALFLDRVVNLVEEGIDVAVRIGELPDSSLVAIPVGRVRRMLVAAPAYIAEHGAPSHPDGLAAHTLVVTTAASPTPEWRFGGAGGRPLAHRVQPRLRTTSNDASIAAALDGFGIARHLSYQVAPLLAAGHLVALLQDFEPPPLPVHVVQAAGRRATHRVRAFVELAVEMLRAEEALR